VLIERDADANSASSKLARPDDISVLLLGRLKRHSFEPHPQKMFHLRVTRPMPVEGSIR
jgi:hypothetical protein